MAPTSLDPEKTFETWELTTASQVWVQTTTFTRHGQPIKKDVKLGPNRAGQKLKISVADREMNQEQIVDEAFDPFRNGMLVRTDADQNLDPETQSTNTLDTQALLGLFGKNGNAFQSAVKALGEVPIRRLRELADDADASAKQVEFLDALIQERYFNGRSQEDAVFNLNGERQPERERSSAPE